MGTMPLADMMELLLERIGYDGFLRSDRPENYEARAQIVQELVGYAREFEQGLAQGQDALQQFLETVALFSTTDDMEGDGGQVSLMTLHSAKGLEFPVVFMIGMEENIFPTSRARNDMSNHAMEEERRLCYVGMTRAKQKLYLINARQRNIFGNESYNRKSRFIEEIPAELTVSDNPVKQPDAREQAEHTRGQRKNFHRYAMDTHALGDGTRDVRPAATPVSKTFEKYQKVQHDKFGVGTVMEISGSGSSMLVSIDFGAAGVKRFAAAYAPIKPVE